MECPPFLNPAEDWQAELTRWLPECAAHLRFTSQTIGPGDVAEILRGLVMGIQQHFGPALPFSHTIPSTGSTGWRIICQYDEESVGRASLELARRALDAALRGTMLDFAAEMQRLSDLSGEVGLGPSTRTMVNAAVARNIPFHRLTEGSLVQLGHGSRQRKILAAATSQTSAIAEDIVQDKDLTRRLLTAVGLPVPAGRPVVSAEDAWIAAQEIGLPVVVKPRALSCGVALDYRSDVGPCRSAGWCVVAPAPGPPAHRCSRCIQRHAAR